ncbi:MAG: arylsulfatase [Anaerolineae bacterium]|nr:arylsulfatase [Anaerolineae bacterium]
MKSTKPNVIMIITDDQGYGDLGCHGNPVAQTPHLDKLHEKSIRLTDFHAAPMCTPTRGQLLTGLDAARNGAVNVSSGRTLLRSDLPTIADVFRANGYRTGMFGKWHLGDNYPYRPQDRGFDESLWFPSSHISSLPDYWENDYFDDVYNRNGSRVRYSGYCTEVFFRETMTWMQQQVDENEPFFAYLPTNAPHAPLYVPTEDREVIERAFAAVEDELPELSPSQRNSVIRFLAMIRNLDGYVGQLRDFLRTLAIERNTVLIFMTDNGSTFGPLYYNAGMRGAKASLWEGGHRVPCFIYWPDGNLGAPRDVDGLTEVQDILPTLIDLCGLEGLIGPPLDGISLAPVLRGDASVPKDRILSVNYSRMPRFDYPSPDSESIIRQVGTAVLWQRWRLLEEMALYSLDTDPGQEHNVIDQYPDIVQQMKGALDTWWQDVEPIANQIQRIIIGSDQENPIMLSACEWRDVFVDQQRQVRIGERKNSYWHLQVERAGTYRFELRRWPKESKLKLTEASPPAQLTDGYLEEGFALPIARARMMIERQWHTQQVKPDDEAAVFTIPLKAGPTLLHTWFDDERNQPICGAYYVYVFRLN